MAFHPEAGNFLVGRLNVRTENLKSTGSPHVTERLVEEENNLLYTFKETRKSRKRSPLEKKSKESEIIMLHHSVPDVDVVDLG